MITTLGAAAAAVGLAVMLGSATGQSAADAPVCPLYQPGSDQSGARCVSVPWQLLEAGPDGRSLVLTLAPGCFPREPRTVVTQTASTISIQVTAPPPPPGPATCIYGPIIDLRAPIAGRQIEPTSWPTPLHYRSLAGQLIGLPRLLGLSPADAEHILWLQGFRAHVVQHGLEVVAQLPGWGLTAPNGDRPHPYSGSVTLTLGRTITRTRLRAPTAGRPAGILAGALILGGGPPLPPGQARPPSAGIVNVFNQHGKLLAQPRTRAGHYFRLRVAPGVYLLSDAQEARVSCRATRARVRPGQTTRAVIEFGCDIP
jgi:hypothetical protein